MANLRTEAECPDIWIEPPFFPVNLNDFRARTNTPDESRIEISTCGLQSASRRIFYVASDVVVNLPTLYSRRRKDKL